jgi:hypothetical protein
MLPRTESDFCHTVVITIEILQNMPKRENKTIYFNDLQKTQFRSLIIHRMVRNSHLNQLHLVLSIESFPFHPSTVFQTHSKNAHTKNRTPMSLPKTFPAVPQ